MILLINHFFNRVCKKVAGLKPAEKWVCEWKKTLYHVKWTLCALTSQHVSFIPQINTQIQNVIIFLKRLLNKLIVLLHFFSCDDLLTWNDMKYLTEIVVETVCFNRQTFIPRILILVQLFFMHCPQLTLKEKCVNFIMKVFPCHTGTHFYFSHHISYWKGLLPWRLYQKTGSLCCLAKARGEKRKNAEAEGIKGKQVLQKHFFVDCQGDTDVFFCSNPQTTWRRSAFSSSLRLPWVVQNECTDANKIHPEIYSENIIYYIIYASGICLSGQRNVKHACMAGAITGKKSDHLLVLT